MFINNLNYFSTVHPTAKGHFTVRASNACTAERSDLIERYNRTTDTIRIPPELVRQKRTGTFVLDIILNNDVVGLVVISMLSPDIEVFPYEMVCPTPSIANLDFEIDAVFVLPEFTGCGLSQYLPYEMARFIKRLVHDNIQNGALNLVNPAPGVGVLIGVYAEPKCITGMNMYRRLVTHMVRDAQWLMSLSNFNLSPSVTSYLTHQAQAINQ